MPHKHRKGFNRDDNDFGRNREFDIPDGELDKVKEIVKRCMENAIKLAAPIKVKVKVGKNWADMKELP